ncbi:MAG: histidine kinase [Bacteroidales bacterium]|nr:histidine kinase [Bacteroidales bacterium]
MKTRRNLAGYHNFDLLLMCFIFLLLFVLPVIFTRVDGRISWNNVFKIWQDRALLIPVFVLNHWILVPRLMIRKRYRLYFSFVAMILILVTVVYYFHDTPAGRRFSLKNEAMPLIKADGPARPKQRTPTPVPPYADLLMFSLLIVAVDTGLSLTKSWHKSEEDRIRLESENTSVQLAMLRHQISPHFFMNTLNNIYALIDTDSKKSKESVMKLSKLMRYMLYENKAGKVKISREFEFIRSYVDLMIIRFADNIQVTLDIPEKYADDDIPVMLFISFIENAFKHGSSYEQKSFIHLIFEITVDKIIFTCINSNTAKMTPKGDHGLGMENSLKRLELLYGDRYRLSVHETEKTFTVELAIPLTGNIMDSRKS